MRMRALVSRVTLWRGRGKRTRQAQPGSAGEREPRSRRLDRLDRFEKTNEMLLNFNNLSSVRLNQMTERYLHHTRALVEMKKDLDSIFRRIRTLKDKLSKQHPEAFSKLSSDSSNTSPTLLTPGASGDSEDVPVIKEQDGHVQLVTEGGGE
ncbi:kxDL motif-containing protein 1 isoform X3 [Pristis pectinata]|uniref:kxDL motif-containing protein 1 isoform X3 n=1 Tax=Pristis pectinata TaxID=685728 RepID=UPI00223E143F|nr:kxDL motif-containing protein 1 isoform X3 [Pristis pectinata]